MSRRSPSQSSVASSTSQRRTYRQPAQERLKRAVQEKKQDNIIEEVYSNSELSKVVLNGLKSSLKKRKKVGSLTPRPSHFSRSPRSGGPLKSPKTGAASLSLAPNDPPRRPRINPKDLENAKSSKVKSPARPASSTKTTSSCEDDMAMEWEPILPSQAVEKTRNVRKYLDDDGIISEIDFQGKLLDLNIPPSSLTLYIVLDTNVLISSLTFARYLMSNKVLEMNPVLVIPWQVLLELDTLKAQKGPSSLKTAHSARDASAFLLKNHDEILFQPQSKWKENSPEFEAKIGDDRVIICGLQLSCTGHNAIILSNDKNLILKARTTRIHALTEEKLSLLIKEEKLPVNRMSKMEKELRGDQKKFPLFLLCHEFARAFHSFLSTTVKYFLKTKFLNMWIFKVTLKPPWNLQDVIALSKMTWEEVSITTLHTRHAEVFEKLSDFFRRNLDENLLPLEVKTALKLSMELASYLPSSLDSIGNMYCSAIRNIMERHREVLASVDMSKEERVERLTKIFDKVERVASQLIGSLCKLLNIKSPVDAEIVPKPSIEQLLPFIPDTIKTLDELLRAMKIISLQHCSAMGAHSQGVSEIVACLSEFMDKHGAMPLEIEDVVAFTSDEKIRNGFQVAINSLEQYLSFLGELQRLIQTTPGSSREILPILS